jgi:hypothetical protein
MREAFQIATFEFSTTCAHFADWLQGVYRQQLVSSSYPDPPDVTRGFFFIIESRVFVK